MFTTKRNNLVAKGGIMQEGGTVDEASGNEVPPGSLKEEVRDDVDAKLSVGEYVFPADVTRYYGLAKLEEMRKEAQANLKQMESSGRMGNSEQVSEEASDEYDEKEFSGAVDQAMQEQDGENGYAEGGVVYDPVASKETYKRAPLKGFEMIPMSDDKGNTIYIPFINGKPQLNIPPGFAIRAAAPKAETTTTDSTTPTAPAADQPRGGGGDRGNMGQRDSLDNTSDSDGEAGTSFGSLAMSAANAGVFGVPGVVAAKAITAYQNAATDPNSAFGPYGFGYTTDSGPNARLAVVKQAIQLSIDNGISPNDALSSILGDSDFSAAISGQDAANARDSVDTGVTVGPAISTPNTSPTALGPATGDSGISGGSGEGGNAAPSGGSAAGAGARAGMGFGGTGSGVSGGGDPSGGGRDGNGTPMAKGGLVSRRNK
jgi:hypothetical protein